MVLRFVGGCWGLGCVVCGLLFTSICVVWFGC